MSDSNDYTIEYEEQGIRILRRIVSIPEINYYEDYGYYLGIWDDGVAADWVYMFIPDHVRDELIESNFEPEFLNEIVSTFGVARFTLDGEPKKKVEEENSQAIHR